MERYRFAAGKLRPGSVLDIACGVGYGSQMLAAVPHVVSVVGVDIDEAAIRYATERYHGPRTTFLRADALRFEPRQQFDNIVSLETIEHVPDPAALLEHLVSLLRRGGLLVGSVPVTLSTDANPHHATDFTERSFRRLGARAGLTELATFRQVQPYSPIALLMKREARAHGVRRGLVSYYVGNPGTLLARVWTTLRYGFENRYLTIAWEKP
jgi:SAM-dependent methyltransferase